MFTHLLLRFLETFWAGEDLTPAMGDILKVPMSGAPASIQGATIALPYQFGPPGYIQPYPGYEHLDLIHSLDHTSESQPENDELNQDDYGHAPIDETPQDEAYELLGIAHSLVSSLSW